MRRSTHNFGVGHRSRPLAKCRTRSARVIRAVRKPKPKQPVFPPKTGCLLFHPLWHGTRQARALLAAPNAHRAHFLKRRRPKRIPHTVQ